MSEIEACLLKSPTRTPWNKGKLVVRSPRCDQGVVEGPVVGRSHGRKDSRNRNGFKIARPTFPRAVAK